jgi:hypothetical protein
MEITEKAVRILSVALESQYGKKQAPQRLPLR